MYFIRARRLGDSRSELERRRVGLKLSLKSKSERRNANNTICFTKVIPINSTL